MFQNQKQGLSYAPERVGETQKLTSNLSSINNNLIDEAEYFKQIVSPVLVAALSEVCVYRPKDPLEYLGQWLIHYRYNQELKRRDVQALIQHLNEKEDLGQGDTAVKIVTEGYTQDHPEKPMWYGGPIENIYGSKSQSKPWDFKSEIAGTVRSNKTLHSVKVVEGVTGSASLKGPQLENALKNTGTSRSNQKLKIPFKKEGTGAQTPLGTNLDPSTTKSKKLQLIPSKSGVSKTTEKTQSNTRQISKTPEPASSSQMFGTTKSTKNQDSTSKMKKQVSKTPEPASSSQMLGTTKSTKNQDSTSKMKKQVSKTPEPASSSQTFGTTKTTKNQASISKMQKQISKTPGPASSPQMFGTSRNTDNQDGFSKLKKQKPGSKTRHISFSSLNNKSKSKEEASVSMDDGEASNEE